MIVLLAESERMFQEIVDEFDRVCMRRKLKENVGQSNIVIFERAREQTIKFVKSYQGRAEIISL